MEPKTRLLGLSKRTKLILIAGFIFVVFAYFLLMFLAELGVIGGYSIEAIIALTKDVTATISSWGYLGVFILMVIEATSFPIPSEVVLPFAGYLVFTGQLAFIETIIVSTVGGVAGALVDYYIGLKGVDFLAKHRLLGKIILSSNQLEVAANWFNKYGTVMVFLGRLIPTFRTLISIPAGCVRMPLTKFIAYTSAGCLIWNTLLVYVGYYLGTSWREVLGVSRYVIIAVVVVIIVIGIVFIIRRMRGKYRVKTLTEQRSATQ